MRTAVLGHVEWVDFVRVGRMPGAGDILRAADAWEEPAGGGAVAAAQLAKLAGGCTLYTALGNDDRGHRSRAVLSRLGVRIEAMTRREPQRRAITFVDASGERSITVMGRRLEPKADDPLNWNALPETDSVYLCAADPAAIRLARSARVLVATSRILPVLRDAGVDLDALVGSARDPSERYQDGDLDPRPGLVVRTEGERGGTYQVGNDPPVRFESAGLPGPIVDAYGCGDSFAAGLAYALAAGHAPDEAVAFAARCGAAALTGRGAFAGQLTLASAKIHS